MNDMVSIRKMRPCSEGSEQPAFVEEDGFADSGFGEGDAVAEFDFFRGATAFSVAVESG
jgi:hypothetical protein